MGSWKVLVKAERDRWSPSQAALPLHRTFDAEAWSVPTAAHQHFVGGGSCAPSALVLQIAEGVRLWSTKVAALISLAKEEGQLAAEEDPDLLTSLFINCLQGAMIRTKCDPSSQCDWLRFALDRFLGQPE